MAPRATVTYYTTLGITPQATKQQIREAYLKLALQIHPDKQPGSSEATSEFQKLNEAHETLIDYKKRAEYNTKLKRQGLFTEPPAPTEYDKRYWDDPLKATRHSTDNYKQYWGQPPKQAPGYKTDYSKFRTGGRGTPRKPEWEPCHEDWENSNYFQTAQDWYERWDKEQQDLIEKEKREHEAAEARAKKAEEEKRVMGWLRRQQMILKEVARLGLEIGIADSSKRGSCTTEEDTSVEGDEELEDHTIFCEDIKLNNVKRDLQQHLSHYHCICREQRKAGYAKEASSAERDLKAVREKSRAGNKPKKWEAPQASMKNDKEHKRERNHEPLHKEEAKGNNTSQLPDHSKITITEELIAQDANSSPLNEDAEGFIHRGRSYKRKQSYVRRWLADQSKIPFADNIPEDPIQPDHSEVYSDYSQSKRTPSISSTYASSTHPVPPPSELKALHMSHANVHLGYWEIVEDDDLYCCMCQTAGTLLQCPSCDIQACENCKSALSAPGGTFGPRAKADWNR